MKKLQDAIRSVKREDAAGEELKLWVGENIQDLDDMSDLLKVCALWLDAEAEQLGDDPVMMHRIQRAAKKVHFTVAELK